MRSDAELLPRIGTASARTRAMRVRCDWSVVRYGWRGRARHQQDLSRPRGDAVSAREGSAGTRRTTLTTWRTGHAWPASYAQQTTWSTGHAWPACYAQQTTSSTGHAWPASLALSQRRTRNNR